MLSYPLFAPLIWLLITNYFCMPYSFLTWWERQRCWTKYYRLIGMRVFEWNHAFIAKHWFYSNFCEAYGAVRMLRPFRAANESCVSTNKSIWFPKWFQSPILISCIACVEHVVSAEAAQAMREKSRVRHSNSITLYFRIYLILFSVN